MKKIFLLSLSLLSICFLQAKTENVTIQGSVGKLVAIVQTPDLADGQKCSMVILMHGLIDNKNEVMLRQIADKLEAAGIASIRFDFNAHGESDGAFENMTVLNEVEDARKVYDYVRSLKYVKKIGMVGHSQGGVVTAMSAGQLGARNISAVVLLAPAAVIRENGAVGNMLGSTYDPMNLPDYVLLFNQYKIGREYMRTAPTLPLYETAAQYKGSACLIHGTGDVLVPYTYSEYFHKMWKKSSLHLLPGYDHDLMPDVNHATDIAAEYLISQLK